MSPQCSFQSPGIVRGGQLVSPPALCIHSQHLRHSAYRRRHGVCTTTASHCHACLPEQRTQLHLGPAVGCCTPGPALPMLETLHVTKAQTPHAFYPQITWNPGSCPLSYVPWTSSQSLNGSRQLLKTRNWTVTIQLQAIPSISFTKLLAKL